ncbi:MAG: prephenate dehydratase [Treponema sp.]|nr:prephenate dehydratase [Candidatus Treponema merdequi]
MRTCAFNGEKGAYAETAIEKYFGTSVKAISVNSFEDIFKSVINKEFDFGMVPVENSTAGCVYQNYDNFVRYKNVKITGSLILRIEHALLAPQGADINSIKTVYSHPQALYQCYSFLKSKKFNQRETVSTATAAHIVKEKNDISNAAIASIQNAELYDLKIIKEGIQDNKNNFTRFFIISSLQNENNLSEKENLPVPDRASFIFTTKDKPGALYNCLGIFKKAGLNIKKIESRPIPENPWTYRFFVDVKVECGSYIESMKLISKFLNELKYVCKDFRMLGIYNEIEI